MKSELPKPIVAILVVVALVAVGLVFWQFTKPPASDVKLAEAGKMSAEDIQRMKASEHAADQGGRQ